MKTLGTCALFRPPLGETCGMATRIHFMGGELAIDVTESPDDVQKAITVGSRGAPFRVDHRQEGDAYVNPAAIAFWHQTPDPERPSS